MAKIKIGAFLTVQAVERVNTITIVSDNLGFSSRKPVLIVADRGSRHTFTIIEDAADYTVSVPDGGMKEAIMYCGTQSGRDGNKFEACGLDTVPGQKTASPVIDAPGIHFECRIVYKTAMDPHHLTVDYDPLYPDKDYHTLYFGEIVACYRS